MTLNQPTTPSNVTNPTLGGSTNEDGEIVVRVYEGSKAEGKVIDEVSTHSAGGSWSAPITVPSGEHTYTARAFEQSPLGNGEGKSEGRTFAVDTLPPTVTLKAPASLSKNTSPTFSGTASEPTEVVVQVYEGTKAGVGPEVARVSTTASGGSWSVGASLSSGNHTYTAVATEASGLGNAPGRSEERTFVVDTEVPVVTLTQPATPTDNTSPTLSGGASEEGNVVVKVYEGPKPEGKVVAEKTTPTSAGGWSATVEVPGGDHTYTARATEASSLGNGNGVSEPETFVVDTLPPAPTLRAPSPARSNNQAPSFSGTASENTEVVVKVYEGTKAEGTVVAKASTIASGGAWSTGPVSPALASGEHTYTAAAFEKSGLGNGEGESESRTFVVDTSPPTVTLKQPATPSSNAAPTFTGTASENTEVVVRVFEGTRPEGAEVARVSTTASGGNWSVGASVPGGNHTYTAIASEASGLGNANGVSEAKSFVVNTLPPTPTLNQPTSPSRNTAPSFSGTASENTEVVVKVYEGTRAEGTVVAKASTTASGGAWSTGAVSPSLAAGEHTYTAIAVEKSGLGNGEGQSETRQFVVNTSPPKVTLTAPTTPSNNKSPSFSGTASENTEVVVNVYEGSKAGGTVVAKASTTASGGSWATGAVAPALATGEHTYTAVATETSGLGNAPGTSESRTFVVNTNPPKVTLKEVPTPTNNTEPAFSGAASEATEVTVRIYEGTKAEGTEVAKVTTIAKEGGWASPAAKLPTGKHLYTAVATEKSGLGNAEGRSETHSFEVNTEPPKVTLNPPALVSGENKPAFSGTASEAGRVTVEIFSGSSGSGTPIATYGAVVPTGGGAWETQRINPLPNGEYSAMASEPSGLKNKEGVSSLVTFVIKSGVPEVSLAKVPTPSNNRSPSFEGKASGTAPVKVEIYEGGVPLGLSVTATVGGSEKWGPVKLAGLLPEGDHSYEAVAIETAIPGTGKSAPVTFVVDTLPPIVTLEAEPTPSANTQPSFRGTTSEPGAVTVDVYAGSKAEGTAVAQATSVSPASGSWVSDAVKPALPEGEYTARATEASSIAGNGAGTSKEVTFVVYDKPPALELREVQSPSANTTPSFAGTTNEDTPVTVQVLREGSPVDAPVTVEVHEGRWATAKLTPALAWGHYTVVATEPSSIEGDEAAMISRPFTLEQIAPSATTEAGNAVSSSSGYLHGFVDPNRGDVESCYFEYGSSTAYGGVAECALTSGEENFPSAANGAISVFARIFGLKPSTTYHFRLHVINEGGGVAVGGDQSFTTMAGGTVPLNPGEPSKPTGNPRNGVLAAIAAELLPNKSLRIAGLLKKGLYALRFKAPAAGTATITWSYTPPKHGKKKPAPVVIASGKLSFHKAGTAAIDIRLTKAGKQILRRVSRLKITVVCSFATAGERPVAASASFELKR